jgi:integrase
MGSGVDPRKVEAKEDDKPELSFADAVEAWMNEHVRVKLKPFTVRDYEKITKVLKDRFKGKSLSAIDKPACRTLHAEMAKIPRRANYYLQVLSAITNYHGVNPNPTKGIKRYREGKHERILSDVELERAFTAIQSAESEKKLSVWACAALRFAILTGARPAEIRAIEWRHLDRDRKRIVLEDSKANRQRIIYCNDAAWTVATSCPRFGKFVFAGEQKNTPYQNLTRAWDKVRAIAKLTDVRLYDCRHSFASQAALAGHNLPMIGTLLGHTVPATTARYVHLINDPAAAASQDVGDRMATALLAAASKAGATPMKAKRRAVK